MVSLLGDRSFSQNGKRQCVILVWYLMGFQKSGCGQKDPPRRSPLWVISEVGPRKRHVRFPPVSDQTADIAGGPFRANNGRDLCWIKMHMARSGDIPGVTVTGLQNRLRILQLGEGD